MIYTVTFNPAIDYIVSADHFSLGKTNRTTEEKILPGGKGINVSTVLTNLHIPNIALGFLAGFTGQEILRLCEEKNICCNFLTLPSGNSRINIKLKNYEGTEINGSGPKVPADYLNELLNQLQNLETEDTLVLAGSIPSSLPPNVYETIMSILQSKKVQIIVDAGGELLLKCLPYGPFLIKPNRQELEEIFNITINDKSDAIRYARQLQRSGARNVMVSLAEDGAVFLSEEGETFTAEVPKGTVINAVGAGDSMIAGFLAGWQNSFDYVHSFRMAVASGSASAYSEELATKEEIFHLYSQIP